MCGGGKWKPFAIYSKISGTFGSLVSNPFGTSGILAMTSDETNVYCCGFGGGFAIYSKSSGTFGSLIPTPLAQVLSVQLRSIMTTCIAVQTVVNLRYTARLVEHSEVWYPTFWHK